MSLLTVTDYCNRIDELDKQFYELYRQDPKHPDLWKIHNEAVVLLEQAKRIRGIT